MSDVLQAVSLFIFIIFIYLYNFFYNFYFYNFYLFLAVLVLRSCEGFSLVVVSGGSRCGRKEGGEASADTCPAP